MKRIFKSNLARYFIPNIGTLILIALMMFVYRASAAPNGPTAPDVTPGTVSYQGMLNDAAGQPINGNTGITFRLYSAPTGGAALWTEAHTGANAVPVSNGLFNVLLGSLAPIPAGVWANGSVYLGVQVGSDTEMSPREVIGKVPYSDSSTISQFGGRPNSFPYVLHLRHFALNVGNYCYGFAPGDTTAAGCDSYPGLDRFTAGLKTYVPSGNGFVSAANNLPFVPNIDFANQTATQYPRWGYAYSFFLNNLGASRTITLPIGACNDVAVYVTQGDVSPDRLGSSVLQAYHRFPGDYNNSNLQGCPCANLDPTIQLPAGSFRLTMLTRGAMCTSYAGIGRVDSTYGLPLGNWIQEAGLSIDWPNLRTYLGEN